MERTHSPYKKNDRSDLSGMTKMRQKNQRSCHYQEYAFSYHYIYSLFISFFYDK